MSTSGGGCGSLDKATKAYMFEYQDPAVLNQANPVQNTWYPILGTLTEGIANVRVYYIGVNIEDDDETLEIRTIVDGITTPGQGFGATNSTNYYAYRIAKAITRSTNIIIVISTSPYAMRAFMIEGHLVQVQVRKTTAAGTGNLTGIVDYGVLKAI